MLRLGSVMVPTSAILFLTVVFVLLFVLVIGLMILNKLLCFADCKAPSLYVADTSDKCLTESDNIPLPAKPPSSELDEVTIASEELYITTKVPDLSFEYSESDDSDDDIFNNYACMERKSYRFSKRPSTGGDLSRSMSIRSHSEKGGAKEDDLETDKSKASIRSNVSDKDILDKESLEEPFKTMRHDIAAVAKIRLFLDPLTSILKIEIVQTFDIVNRTKVQDRKKSLFTSEAALVSKYQIHCTLLPAKKYKFKTKVKQGDDPVFNEKFTVPKFTAEDVSNSSLRFRLYASNNSTMDIIGQCTFELNSVDLSHETDYNLTMNHPKDDDIISTKKLSISSYDMQSLQSENIEPNADPEIIIGLGLNSNTGRLTVEIVKGTNFSKDKNKDFYIKLSLFSSTSQELSHTKTSIRKNTTSPVFRESFMFQVALFQMKEVTLIISAFVKKTIHRKDLLGWISLGYKSSGEEEANHWNQIVEEPQTEIVRSHKLHKNTNSKKVLL